MKNYNEYGITPYMLLHSYINIDFGKKETTIVLKLPSKLDYTKSKNTMNTVAYYSTLWSDMYARNTELCFSLYSELLEMCCKTVCQKNRYKYAKPYHRLYRGIWGTIQWKTSCLNIVDLCEIVYHIKNRKYAKLYNTLLNLDFSIIGCNNVIYTVQYITEYTNYETNPVYKAVLICLIYMYLGVNNNFATFTKRFQDVIMEKAVEHTIYIKDMSMFPKYLRNFMIEKIEAVKI
jgi:hypothetical protein